MPAEQFSPHRFPVRIYFEDTDAGGIVYHGSYLRFAERARTEFLRALGFEQSSLMKEQQCVIVLRSCNIDFLKPAHLACHIGLEAGYAATHRRAQRL